MRGSTKNILKFIACIVLFITTDRVLGLVLNKHVASAKRGTIYAHKYMLFKAKPSIVILGSSRAKYHYNTSIFQKTLGVKTINYGIAGTSVFTANILLKTLQQHHTPDVVVLDIKPDEFVNGPNVNQIDDFYPLIDKMSISDEELRTIAPFEKYKLLSYTYRYNNQFFETLATVHGKKDDTATIDNYTPLAALNTKFEKATIVDNKLDTLALQSFKEAIQVCKRNNIKLVVCISPFYANFKYSRSIAETEKICTQNNVTCLNYTNNALVNFNEDEFSDITHLNVNGSTKFTNDFIERSLSNFKFTSH